MSIRDSFVEEFGEEQARCIEAAANHHNYVGMYNNKGSDPFKWAILVCISYQCMEIEEYRNNHGITVPFEQLQNWAVTKGNLNKYDGDYDSLSMLAGIYNKWLKYGEKHWEEFIAEFEEWAERCPLEYTDDARLRHLIEEVNELYQKPDDILEMADIGLILLKHCYAKKVNLLDAMRMKFDMIKNSEWYPPDENGVVRRKK